MWFFYKNNENDCLSELFAELIQTQNKYPTFLDKTSILNWRLLVISTLHKKWSFRLQISSVNVTKSAVPCGLDYIYWSNPKWKICLFVQWFRQVLIIDPHEFRLSTCTTNFLVFLSIHSEIAGNCFMENVIRYYILNGLKV